MAKKRKKTLADIELARRKAIPKNGRPPAFSDAEQLKNKAEAYFAHCDKKRLPPEKAGLCLALGITRETYSQYRKKEEFSDTIKRCDALIQQWWVRRLSGQAATGAIFYLKNAFKEEFKDKYEGDVHHKGSIIYLPQKK
jgi:hypothetical protein